MFTTYNNLPDHSRVWIYQSNRTFTKEETTLISKKVQQFIEQWKRHGADLKGSFIIKYNQFLVLLVDENFNTVSGCSIDASVQFIKQLEAEFNIDLTNKMNISFKDGKHIHIVKLADFKDLAKTKKITEKTIVFNNLIKTKRDFNTYWEVPAKNSWHKQFLCSI